MGCSDSKIYNDYPRIALYKKHFEKLGMAEVDVAKFHKLFRRIDVDDSGKISLEELFFTMNLDVNPLSQRLFNSFDNDISGELDFLEFTLYLWNFCSFSGESLALYSFTLYGNNNRITYNELKGLMRDLYGERFDLNLDAQEVMNALAKVLSKTGESGYITDTGVKLKGHYTYDDFKEFSRYHQVALFPLFTMQDTFKTTLSSINWKLHTKENLTKQNIEDLITEMKGVKHQVRLSQINNHQRNTPSFLVILKKFEHNVRKSILNRKKVAPKKQIGITITITISYYYVIIIIIIIILIITRGAQRLVKGET